MVVPGQLQVDVDGVDLLLEGLQIDVEDGVLLAVEGLGQVGLGDEGEGAVGPGELVGELVVDGDALVVLVVRAEAGQVPVVEVVDEVGMLIASVVGVGVEGGVVDVHGEAVEDRSLVDGLVVGLQGPAALVLLALVEEAGHVGGPVGAALVETEDEDIGLRTQLAVDVDLEAVEHRPVPAVLGRAVGDADGHHRRGALDVAHRSLEGLVAVGHLVLVLMGVDETGAEVEETDPALVMGAEHGGGDDEAAARGRQVGEQGGEPVVLGAHVETESVHVGHLEGEGRELRAQLVGVDGAGLPGICAVGADHDVVEEIGEAAAGRRVVGAAPAGAVGSAFADRAGAPGGAQASRLDPVNGLGAVDEGVSEVVVAIAQVAGGHGATGVVLEPVVVVGRPPDAADEGLIRHQAHRSQGRVLGPVFLLLLLGHDRKGQQQHQAEDQPHPHAGLRRVTPACAGAPLPVCGHVRDACSHGIRIAASGRRSRAGRGVRNRCPDRCGFRRGRSGCASRNPG